MRRALRISVFAGAVLLLGLGVSVVPTVWGKPWSIEQFHTRVFLDLLLRHPMLLSQLRVHDGFLQNVVDGEPFQLYDYPLNQLDGVQVTLPDFMLNVHPLFDAGGADQNVLQTSFVKRIGEIEGLSPEARAKLTQAARHQIEISVLPAWQRLADYLPELQAQATETVGAWKHPEGSLYYGWALRSHTTTKLSADEIHALGLREVERIQREIRAILSGEGIDVLDLGATLGALNKEDRFL